MLPPLLGGLPKRRRRPWDSDPGRALRLEAAILSLVGQDHESDDVPAPDSTMYAARYWRVGKWTGCHASRPRPAAPLSTTSITSNLAIVPTTDGSIEVCRRSYTADSRHLGILRNVVECLGQMAEEGQIARTSSSADVHRLVLPNASSPAPHLPKRKKDRSDSPHAFTRQQPSLLG